MPTERFHFVCGMPRAGSTLLCNILNQNPRFYASDTSPLAAGAHAAFSTIVGRPEHTSELAKDPAILHERTAALVRGVVEGWYSVVDKPVVFDKDRSNVWLPYQDVLRVVSPRSKLLCLIRDPREVVASALRQQERNPFVWAGPDPFGRTLSARVEALIGPGGLIRGAIASVEAVLMATNSSGAQTDHILIIDYHQLAAAPQATLMAIYDVIDEPEFSHDFENVENVARDLDVLYKNLWPHYGAGKVEDRPGRWDDVLPAGLAAEVLKRFPLLCSVGGYR